MKWLWGLCGVAFLAVGLAGCDDGSPKAGTPETLTKDNRPAGFEDMMKGMDKDMQKAGKNPKALNKSAPDAKASPAK